MQLARFLGMAKAVGSDPGPYSAKPPTQPSRPAHTVTVLEAAYSDLGEAIIAALAVASPRYIITPGGPEDE